jgi:hypothetical protein
MASRPLPHVGVASFCERVLVEADGIFSLIRLFDTLSVPPEPLMQGELNLTLFVVLKSGPAARGPYDLVITVTSPTGRQIEATPHSQIELGGDEQGAAITVQIRMRPDGMGVYWFDVKVEGTAITSVPLRLQPVQSTGDSVPSGGAPQDDR